jgi:hypothetical protein
MEDNDEFLEPIKFIRGSMRRRTPIEEELRQARKSPAYWWFKCLEASDEYRSCCDMLGYGELGETYSKFGNIFDYPHFDSWWIKQGRFLFIQEEQKKVKVFDDGIFRKADANANTLILEIPLTLRKQTVMRQIGKELKKAYEGREVDIQKNSSAKVKFEKSKIRMTTVELLLKIHRLRKKHPELSLNQLGIRAGVELDLFARITNSEDMDDCEYERTRRMTIAVSRYLKQARHLIGNAANGIFPSIKPRNTTVT